MDVKADPDAAHTAVDGAPVSDIERQQEMIRYKSHNSAMMMNSLKTMMMDHTMLVDNDQPDFGQTLGSSLANFATSVAYRKAITAPPETDPLARRAIFDLNGSANKPPLAVVPHQMVFESIPRPEARSMSVS